MSKTAKNAPFTPLKLAVLTVSDTRTEESDVSGNYLRDSILAAGHQVVDKQILRDDIYLVRALISKWIADEEVNAILISGGTGMTGRDISNQAVIPLLDKEIPGFGELFRSLSYSEIGTSTIQSRAFAGLANATLIFAMPGSPGGCRTAWEQIIQLQIDSRTGPCNFVNLLPRFREV